MTPDHAVITDHSPSPPSSWLPVRALPEYAREAREFATNTVAGFPHDSYEVALITSEIVTNAIVAAEAFGPWPDEAYPIGVDLVVTCRYVHLAVTDPDFRPMAASDQGGQFAEHGRGLHIVDEEAAVRWVVYEQHSKTVHVVMAAPGVTLTPAELKQIRRPR
ncbi:ATP-binding protein [Actinoallomurus sp. NPDC050550]|uniref:ATP-binding protein n=1 Tax=Actinoallomurus sp. NPDC050550 TaxID=3154937 RepID=UPI0033EF8404